MRKENKTKKRWIAAKVVGVSVYKPKADSNDDSRGLINSEK